MSKENDSMNLSSRFRQNLGWHTLLGALVLAGCSGTIGDAMSTSGPNPAGGGSSGSSGGSGGQGGGQGGSGAGGGTTTTQNGP
jgi:hypothetical protein